MDENVFVPTTENLIRPGKLQEPVIEAVKKEVMRLRNVGFIDLWIAEGGNPATCSHASPQHPQNWYEEEEEEDMLFPNSRS